MQMPQGISFKCVLRPRNFQQMQEGDTLSLILSESNDEFRFPA